MKDLKEAIIASGLSHNNKSVNKANFKERTSSMIELINLIKGNCTIRHHATNNIIKYMLKKGVISNNKVRIYYNDYSIDVKHGGVTIKYKYTDRSIMLALTKALDSLYIDVNDKIESFIEENSKDTYNTLNNDKQLTQYYNE